MPDINNLSANDALVFHVLGMPYSATSEAFAADANTQNVMAICRILSDLGHTVYHYGNYGSNPQCARHFDVLDEMRMNALYEGDAVQHSETGYFVNETPEVKKEFIKRAIELVSKNHNEGDFLLGIRQPHDLVAMACPGLNYVHHSVGHAGWSPQNTVFASQFVRNFVLAKEHIRTGALSVWQHSAVIPHFLRPDDYTPSFDSENYCVFVGRLSEDKGLQLAIDACAKLNKRLLILGQGLIKNFELKGVAEYVGFVSDVNARNDLVSRADALIAPTQIPECFGMTVIEAQMLGVPTITSDWGAFPETNLNNVTGYRCTTDHEYVEAIEKIPEIDRRKVRRHAVNNFSEEIARDMYGCYFDRLRLLIGSRQSDSSVA